MEHRLREHNLGQVVLDEEGHLVEKPVQRVQLPLVRKLDELEGPDVIHALLPCGEGVEARGLGLARGPFFHQLAPPASHLAARKVDLVE